MLAGNSDSYAYQTCEGFALVIAVITWILPSLGTTAEYALPLYSAIRGHGFQSA